MNRKPHPSDELIVSVIAHFIKGNGYPPTRREVARMSGYSSSSEGQRVVERLERKGLIERDPTIPRGIRVVKMIADTEEV